MVVGLTAGVLAGCANPKDTTEEFLTAIQKGDVEKARTFVESDKEFNKLNGGCCKTKINIQCYESEKLAEHAIDSDFDHTNVAVPALYL
ncbi:hypothetical protein C797_28998 [Bacillus thuringiensis Sbt003]|nr:hypothetical protein C797_28998 [Bacillus thuringiensis Sbt003]